MLPAHFIPLATLPVTPHGKIDLARLPAPDQSRPDLEQAFVPARTRTEQDLAHIWSDVLGLGQVGIHDNFFDLGGHSLLATRIISRVQASLGLDLPLRLMFETPTIAQLALTIDGFKNHPGSQEADKILPVSRQKYRKTP
jgi:acyl carrier protein